VIHDDESARLLFYGGPASALLPIGLFFAAVAWITTSGVTAIEAYLAPLCLVLGLCIFLAKSPSRACAAILSGVTDRTLATMVFAFLGAGAFGQLLVASGLVEGLVWLTGIAGIGGGAFVVASFLIAAVIATAIGTSTGTCVTVVPILYPAGVFIGAHPALLLGAIYSGARFGDNIAPISDTTIASAYTQGADVAEVVGRRLKYAFLAGAISIGLYAVSASLLSSSAEPVGKIGEADPNALLSLSMLFAPALTVVLCIRGRPLIEAIWAGIFAALGIGLLTGLFDFHDIYRLEPPKSVGGALTAGIISMRDVIFLAIFIMALVGVLREAGVLQRLALSIVRFATTPKRAELAIFVLVSLMCPLCAGNTPAMLFSGPVVRQIGTAQFIHRVRRANLMDLAGNGATENLPHINTMLALAGVMVVAHETMDVPLVSLMEIGLLSFHPFALSFVGLLAIFTGWGAKRG
jgi:Na+/H+ antiporter NhaC